MPTTAAPALPRNSLTPFFEEDAQFADVQPSGSGLDSVIENLKVLNSDIGVGNELVIGRLDSIIDRLDGIVENGISLGLVRFGGDFDLAGSLMGLFDGFASKLTKSLSGIARVGSTGLIQAITQTYLQTKEVFSGFGESITSSINRIGDALNPQNIVDFLMAPIDAFMAPIQASIQKLKNDVTNVFQGVGDIIAAPFRMVGNLTSFLFGKKDKGYPFERLEGDLATTNSILEVIEQAIREVLIGELEFKILENVIEIHEKLDQMVTKSDSNVARQNEIASETALLTDQRADAQNSILASISEKIGGLGVKQKTGGLLAAAGGGGGGGLIDQALEAIGLGKLGANGLMMRGALGLGGVAMGASALGGMSDNYQKRMKGEDTATDYLGTTLQGAASGAMIGGSVFGPMGALVGGGIGAGVAGVGSLITALTPSQKEAEEKRRKASEDKRNEEAIDSLKKRKVLVPNWFGDSKVDEVQLKTLSANELRALISFDDFNEEDKSKIQKALDSRLEQDKKLDEEAKAKKEQTKTEAETKYSEMDDQKKIADLEKQKETVVNQLKAVNASESQIGQVTKDFDKQIEALKGPASTGTPTGTKITAQEAADFDAKGGSRSVGQVKVMPDGSEQELLAYGSDGNPIWGPVGSKPEDLRAKTQSMLSTPVDINAPQPAPGPEIRTPVPEGGLQQDTTKILENNSAMIQNTVDSMAMQTMTDVGSAVTPSMMSSSSMSSSSNVMINSPSTTINAVKGNTFQGIKSTVSMNN